MKNAPDLQVFEPKEWLANERNIALTDGEGNFTLFEYERPGVFNGHVFFNKETRGNKALALAKQFLKEIFEREDVDLIQGTTPVSKLGAIWLNKKLGFKNYGTIEILNEPHLIFILTKTEYKENNNG